MLIVFWFLCAVVAHPCPTTPSAECLTRTVTRTLEALKVSKDRIATAESLTNGMIASSLVDVVGYGYFVIGGVSTYDTSAKRTLLGVTAPDVYTEECAVQMAIGVLERTVATIAVAVTGHAGPVWNSSTVDV